MLIGQPKVYDLTVAALIVKHDILKLDIAMHYAILMNVLNGLEQLLEVESADCLI